MKGIYAWFSRFPYWWSIPLLAVAAIMFGMSSRNPMWMDEYAFYRLSSELPNYASTSNWFFVDRPSTLSIANDWKGLNEKKAFQLDYDTPIYTHTPLAPILVSPIVKGLNWLADKGVIPHIESQQGLELHKIVPAETMTMILRIISIGLFVWSLYLIFRIMEKKVGKHAYLMWLPLCVGITLLQGAMLFYWDEFMMFFLVLTLYIQEVHPDSKWKYVTACCLVNTKIFIGIAFLLPCVIKEVKRNWRTCWKMMLPALSIIPFWIATVVVTHNPIYIISHYWYQIPILNFVHSLNSPMDYFNIFMTMGMPFFLAVIFFLLYKPNRYLEYTVFLIMGIAYVWGMGLGLTYLPAMLCSSALAMPLVSYKWNLIERTKKLMGIGEMV